MARKIVVIGGDAAGMSAASLAKRRQPDLEFHVFEMGDYTSFSACGMPYYVGGVVPEIEDLVVVHPSEFREKRGIDVSMRHRAEKVHPKEKVLEVRDLEADRLKEVPYDELIVATGAVPIVPPGMDPKLPGVFALRSLPETEKIRKYIHTHECKTGVVVGSGYIGMEMAEALHEAGLEVTAISRSKLPMAGFEDEIGEAVVEELIRQDVNVKKGVGAQKLEQAPNGKLKLTLADGEEILTDIVILGSGIVPRSELAEEAGLELGIKKAVKVDRHQRTSHEHIWSGGDCAEVYHRLTGKNAYIPLALNANRQGRVIAENLTGLPSEFPGTLGTAICKIFDLTVARTGLTLKQARELGIDAIKVVSDARSKPHYYPGSAMIKTAVITEKGGKRVWGVSMSGTKEGVAKRIDVWAVALSTKMSLQEIYDLDLSYAPPYSPVWDPVLIASQVAMKKAGK